MQPAMARAISGQPGGRPAAQAPASTIQPQRARQPPRPAPAPAKRVISVPGIDPHSPFGIRLSEELSGQATLLPAAAAGEPRARWHRHLAGTGLAFNLGEPPPNAPAPLPTITLDLFGGTAVAGTVWRIVDHNGVCVLHADSALGRPPSPLLSLHLVESPGSGESWRTLSEAHVSTHRGYRALLERTARILPWMVKRAIVGRPESPPCWQPASPPPASRRLRNMLARTGARLRDKVCSEIWAIGRIETAPESFIQDRTLTPESWIEIPGWEGFIADPFRWPGEPDQVLCEIFSHRSGLGVIAAVNWRDGTTAPAQIDFATSTHLSYPFVFVDGDRVVCLPEMAAQRRQVMYTLHRNQPPAPLCVVAEDVAMGDPTLFRHAGYYWIAYNDTALGMHENLCLRYARRLEGPWIPHPHNPVKIDIRSSRPGGTPFNLGARLFRPAQDCSNSYGCAITINEVITCSPDNYREQRVAVLSPDKRARFGGGLHTLSIGPDGTWIDGKRFVLDARILAQRLARRFGAIRLPPRGTGIPRSMKEVRHGF